MSKDLFEMLGKFSSKHELPSVDQWHPERTGEIDILINRKGEWFHEGGKFERQDLARMFSSILRKDDGDYFLVTPAEKLRIRVEDVPFSVVLMQEEEGNLKFITSLGDEVVAGNDHRLEFQQDENGAFIPYINIRNGLLGKLQQNTYYQLMEFVKEEEGGSGYYIESGGVRFEIPSEE